MKILHISALQLWSMDGKGGMPSLRETLKGHIAGGHTVEIVLPKYELFSSEIEPVPLNVEKDIKIHQAACLWVPWFKKIRNFAQRLGKNGEMPYGFRWGFNMLMLIGLTCSLICKAITVRRKGFIPQLIYANNQYAALAGYLLGCIWRIPNVTRLYGTFLADLMKKPFVSLRYPTAAAGYLVPSDLLICANDGTRGDEVARRFGVSDKRFRFWQNGVQPPSQKPDLKRENMVQRFSPSLRAESKWAVSCSRLSYWKRIDRMIHALSICRGKGADCQLIIAGDGEEKEKLKKLCLELGVGENVIWLGAVAHDDIWALMNVADIFIITNDVTNRCNPLYEAAWAGLPVISIIDPSTSDLLIDNENALLVDKDDVLSLGGKLVELCNDEALSEKLRAGQRKLAESFRTWEARMKVEVAELEKLVNVEKRNRDNQDSRASI